MSLGASFNIGRSALAAYQAALSVAGQNIANVANPDYTRQTARLSAQVGGPVLSGVRPGGGVRVSQLNRHIDEALEQRLREAAGRMAAADATATALNQTETLYNELTDADLSSQLSEFFAQFSALETEPDESSARNLVLATAEALSHSMSRMRNGLVTQVEDLNESAAASIERANAIAEEIGGLNELIVQRESDGVTVASALRDQRDAYLRELSEIVQVTVREQPNGSINVYINSDPLVQFDRSRGLTLETEIQQGLEVAAVRFADDGATVRRTGGSLAGQVTARDDYILDQLQRLDRLAEALVFEVNKVHTTGVGLEGRASLISEHAVGDPDAALNSVAADLPFPVQNGTFIVHVRDTSTGQVITRQIDVDLDGLNGDDTTLNDLAAALDSVPGITAQVTTDNRLQVDAGSGGEFWFTDDRSDVLAALNLGGMLTGTDAGDIALAGDVANNPALLATSQLGETNDGTNAGRVAILAQTEAGSALLSGASIQSFQADMVNDLAVEAGAALKDYESADLVYGSLYAQREATSGVSLDEEAINLTQFESAYQGAARYLSVLDELTNELLALL